MASGMQNVTPKIYHGGVFKALSSGYCYVGGKVRTFTVDPDELCFWYLRDLVKKCGNYEEIQLIYYLIPGKTYEAGLRKVFDDSQVREMGEIVLKSRCIDLFVVHNNVELAFLITGNSLSQVGDNLTQKPKKLAPKRSAAVASISCAENTPLPNTEKPTHPNATQESVTFSKKPVPVDYEWTDPRPESPIPFNDLIGMNSESGDDVGIGDLDSIDPNQLDGVWDDDYEMFNESADDDYEPELDGDQEVERDDVDLVDENVDDDEDDLEDLADPILNDDLDSSDDEWMTAREQVKGFNKKLLDLAHQLQEDARMGKLGTQTISTPLNGDNSERDPTLSDYEDSDEEMHTPPGSDEEDTVSERRAKRSLLVGKDTDFSVFSWKVGQRFPTRQDFKKAVAKVGVFQGRNLYIAVSNKSRQQRLGVKCAPGCPFKLYASWDTRRASFVVKTVVGEHTCTRNMEKNKQCKSTWLADQLLEVFKTRPHWPANEIIETVRRAYRVIIKRDFAYKVKYYAHRKLHGSMKDHYAKVGKYIEALRQASPGTDVHLLTQLKDDPNAETFQRLYVCFEGVQSGWKGGCRKVICIDACFLKTFLGGQLMVAVGRDGNDQMYPLAWSVVEGENNSSWEWFLEHLQSSLDLGDGTDVAVLSDEHQAILTAVGKVLPNAEHRHCARHIFANWHKNFRGDDMKLKFWVAAKAYNMAAYKDALADLEKANPAAAQAFESYDPKLFCRAFLKTNVKADVITSNMAETFNGYIIHARAKHVLYMMEDIRASLMQRLVRKRQEMEKWKTDICPRIQLKLEREKKEAAMCEVMPSSDVLFQVNHQLDSLTVNLEDKTCTCRKWDMTGVPCCHACAAIFFIYRRPEEYVEDCYKRQSYLQAYSVSIPPLAGEKHWPDINVNLEPPQIKIGPGRPRKNRRKDPFEDPKKPGKLTKHGFEITCGLCGAKGHNRKHCPNKETATPQEPQPKRPRGRPRKDGTAPQPRQPEAPTHHQATAEPSRIGRGGRVVSRGGRARGGTNMRGGSNIVILSSGRGRGSHSGRGTSSVARGSTTTARARGRGRAQVPVGFGVLYTPDGSVVTNQPRTRGRGRGSTSNRSNIAGSSSTSVHN